MSVSVSVAPACNLLFLTVLLISKMFSHFHIFVISEALHWGLCGIFLFPMDVLHFECAVVTLLRCLADTCPLQFSAHGSVRTRHWFISCVPCPGATKSTFFMAFGNVISASSFLITFTHSAGHHWDLQSPLFSAISHFLIALANSQPRSPAWSGGWEHALSSLLGTELQTTGILHYLCATEDLIYLAWCQAFFKHRVAQHNLQFLYQLQPTAVLSHGSACFLSFWYVLCINNLI